MAYNTTAKGLSALGRNGDNTLLHVSKDELAGLQSLIGHKLPTNPDTGLQEAFDLKNIIAMLGIGALGAATGGAALAAAPGITTAGATALGAGQGALLGGAYSASQGKGFGAGALGGALSGGLGAYGGSNLPGASTAQTTTSMSEPADALLTTPKIAAAPELPYGYDKFLPAAPDKFTVPYGAGIKTPTEFSLGDTSKYQSLVNDIPDVAQTNEASFLPATARSDYAVTAKDIPLTDKLSNAIPNQLSAMGNKDNMWEWGKTAGMGALLGSSAQDMVEQNQAMANQIRQEKLAAQANEQQQQQYFKDLGYPLASLSDLNNSDTQTQFNYYKNIINPKQGYAAGGPITMTLPMGGVPVTATFPARYASELEQIDIPHEINQAQNVAKEGAGMANGGYINTQPVNPNAFYPQSQIHSAQPYPAATPQRHEIIEGFEDGGMLDGPGDGMSDDIPANIDGEEEIRLADGEFVVPPDLVRMLGFGDPEKGADLLDNLLPIVRQAAHGKKEQIKQDAGKLAAEKMLARAVKGKA
jgi:hypothetical protein